MKCDQAFHAPAFIGDHACAVFVRLINGKTLKFLQLQDPRPALKRANEMNDFCKQVAFSGIRIGREFFPPSAVVSVRWGEPDEKPENNQEAVN